MRRSAHGPCKATSDGTRLTTGASALTELRKPSAEELRRDVTDAMTTNETSFFRDIKPFEELRTFVLPEMLGRRQERALTRVEMEPWAAQEAGRLQRKRFRVSLSTCWDERSAATETFSGRAGRRCWRWMCRA